MKQSVIELGKCITQYRNEIWVDDATSYGQITVSSTRKVSLRGRKRGSEIGRKRQFVLDLKTYPNTLTFTRQGVYDGAIGFAPLDTDECIATENMPMFSLNDGINRAYLEQLLLSPVFKDEIKKLAPKGAAQKSIHERILLKIAIPLPTPEAQKEIATIVSKKRQLVDVFEQEISHQQSLLGKLKQAILQEAIQGKLTEDWRAANLDADSYLGSLLHYVHLNPVRAGICDVSDLENYRWSSYWYLHNRKLRPAFLDLTGSLAHAGSLADTAVGRRSYAAYLKWLATDEATQKEMAFDKMCRGWALGSQDFKKDLLQTEGLLKDGNFGALRLEGKDLLEANELLWESMLRRGLDAARKTTESTLAEKKSADWKVWIARELKRRSSASNSWIARNLHMGVAQAVSLHVGKFERALQEGKSSEPYATFIQRFTE